MSKHKSEDYKLSAVKYYLNNNVSLDDVCEIFDCPKQSLYRWVKRYEELEEIKRISRKPKSYKITNNAGFVFHTKYFFYIIHIFIFKQHPIETVLSIKY